MKQWTLIFIIFALTAEVFATQGITVFTPPPYLSTKTDELHVIGHATSQLVELKLNGESIQIVPVKDSIFHTRVKYGYGLNELEIIPIFSGDVETEVASRTIEILCGPDVTGRYQRLYPQYVFHDDRAKEVCLKCHDPKLDGPLPALNNAFCHDCHNDLLQRDPELSKSKHENCNACHKTGKNLMTLTSNIGYFEESTCFICHENRRRSFGMEYIHGPVAVGSCTVCHDPHGSKHEHSLVSAEEILCFGCHDFQRELKDMPVQHNPFDRGMCGACHDPHSTDNKWNLVKTSETVCLECHETLNGGMAGHSHPYNVVPKNKLVTKLDLSDSGRLECLSCHNPHASTVSHLLRTDKEFTCSGCHSDKTN